MSEKRTNQPKKWRRAEGGEQTRRAWPPRRQRRLVLPEERDGGSVGGSGEGVWDEDRAASPLTLATRPWPGLCGGACLLYWEALGRGTASRSRALKRR